MVNDTTRLRDIEAILSHIPDPEIPVVSIRELGILRDIRLGTDHTGAATVEVFITPTYGGCPALDQIRDDIVSALAQHGFAATVTRQLAPAWTTDWITPETREKLRAYGIAPPVIRFAPKRIAVHAHSTGADGLNDAQAEGIHCPQCHSANTTETSHFGSTACKALYKCLDCLEPFDYFKPY
jgi:ring-1,2-phenylacetyl-CoA epoxidase subunit PaaD